MARLTALAAYLDGAPSERSADALTEFNRLAGTDLLWREFQGIHGAEDHGTWVRRVLYREGIKPAAGVTRAELVEVVRRAMAGDEHPAEQAAYMAVFDANVPMAGASNLIFYPPQRRSGTGGGEGWPAGAYDPMPERIVEWALSPDKAPIRL